MPQPDTVVKDCITVTNHITTMASRFVAKEVMTKMLTYVGMGALVKDLIGTIVPNQPNPVMAQMKVLSRDMGNMSRKMSEGFSDMKSFIVDHTFYTKFASLAATLMDSMNDTIRNPCAETKGMFWKAVQDKPPLEHARKLINQLKVYKTNPLKMAMDTQDFPNYKTFRSCKDAINGVLAQFLILECHLNGLFWNSNEIGPKQLIEKMEKLEKEMETWSSEYHAEMNSWTKIEKYMHKIQDQYTHIGNEAKKELMVKAFDDMMTYHAFTIIVYNDCSGWEKHAFEGPNHIVSFRRGGCNMAILRSTFRKGTDNPLRKVTNFMSGREHPPPDNDRYGNYIEELYEKAANEAPIGCVALIRSDQGVAWGYAVSANRIKPYYYEETTTQKLNVYFLVPVVSKTNFRTFASIL